MTKTNYAINIKYPSGREERSIYSSKRDREKKIAKVRALYMNDVIITNDAGLTLP